MTNRRGTCPRCARPLYGTRHRGCLAALRAAANIRRRNVAIREWRVRERQRRP